MTTVRIFVVGARAGDRDRADQIIDALDDPRIVRGGEHEWRILFPGEDASEAMRRWERELAAVDPDWFRLLDFEIARPRDGTPGGSPR